jgi:predicted RNA polymerase sigma factor
MAADTRQTIETVWRMEAPRLIAGLTRVVRDVGLAEDLAQDALVAALEQWPSEGLPRNPGAWLMAAAKHRAIDQLRRRQLLQRKHEEIAYTLASEQQTMPAPERAWTTRSATISCA